MTIGSLVTINALSSKAGLLGVIVLELMNNCYYVFVNEQLCIIHSSRLSDVSQ